MATYCDTKQAVQILQAGGLVALPTETVYGLAANALDARAVARIFSVKGRPSFNPIIVHLANALAVKKYVEFAGAPEKEKALEILAQFWPGPLTVLLPKNDLIPSIVTAGRTLCGFRVPKHELTLSVIKECGFPLAAPSANRSNRRSPTRAGMVAKDIGDAIGGILDGGPCDIGIESTVVEIIKENTLQIHRPGAITKEALKKAGFFILETSLSLTSSQESRSQQVPLRRKSKGKNDPVSSQKKSVSPDIVSPGQLSKHYAPRHPLILLSQSVAIQTANRNLSGDAQKEVAEKLAQYLRKNGYERLALLGFQEAFVAVPAGCKVLQKLDLSPIGDLLEAAQNLFLFFDKFDSLKCDAILACELPAAGLGLAINDRLHRAAGFVLK